MDIDLLDGAFYADDPFPAYAFLRDHAPLHRDERNGLWAVSRHADVKAISQDPDRFSSAGGSRPDTGALPMMIDTDGAEHRRRRRLVSEGFTPAAVRGRTERIRQLCDDIIDAVCTRGRCDLVAEVAAPLPLHVIADMLDLAPEDRGMLLQWSDALLASQSGEAEAAARATEVFVDWQDYILAQVAQRRSAGATHDLVGVLAHAEADGEGLDDMELVFELLLILIGGDETTRHVISGGMAALLRHPDQLQALRSDRSLLAGAVEEMLRWVSPIKNMTRTATVDVELHATTIAAGDKVLLLYEAANRDERAFTDPDRFDIHRTPNDHVAFGFGAHLCLGSRLARAELTCMVDRLLERLPDLRIEDGEHPRRRSYFISGYETLPVTFTPTPIRG